MNRQLLLKALCSGPGGLRPPFCLLLSREGGWTDPVPAAGVGLPSSGAREQHRKVRPHNQGTGLPFPWKLQSPTSAFAAPLLAQAGVLRGPHCARYPLLFLLDVCSWAFHPPPCPQKPLTSKAAPYRGRHQCDKHPKELINCLRGGAALASGYEWKYILQAERRPIGKDGHRTGRQGWSLRHSAAGNQRVSRDPHCLTEAFAQPGLTSDLLS